ncbi:MAG: helix-turn-helix transcriptional regulator [Caldilineaceae bacterium]|nr:helix-turn-helix transcriptional regulator [Caldilineaceae bacterium]
MIKNERQYRITKKQAACFLQTLELLRQQPAEAGIVHPLVAQAREDALRSQLADLEEQLQEYEALKAGSFDLDALNGVAELPSILIKARIALGLRHKDLAERLGLKEQQIQRYEATDYATASLTRINEVANALRMESNKPAQTPNSHS